MPNDPQVTLRASTVQFEAVPDRPDLNLKTIRRLATAAAKDGSQLVVFPEMCLIGYWHLRKQTTERLKELAEPDDGASIRAVSGLARELGVGIGVGYLEAARDGRLHNSYTVCLPDGSQHTHRKIHAFEHEAIESGSQFTVFDTPWGAKIGILICWDNNLVENVRATALLGATVLLAPHQTGGTNSPSPRGMKAIPAVVWENRTADPEAIQTWVADEAIVTADLELGLVPLSTGRRWIRGRRPELYAILNQKQGNELNARAARFSAEPVNIQ